MKLYHKINDYLLYNHPNIWVTRIHLFLPIGLLILLGVLGVNIFMFPYNIKEPLSSGDGGFWLMVIPVLIYLVYWFIFQARYNVEKSGGKLSIFQEYLNYFSYFAIYSIALLLVLIIPLSTDYKIMTSISESEYREDLNALNLGHEVVNKIGSLTKNGNLYSFQTSNYIYDYSKNSNAYQNIKVNERELITIIQNFNNSFNKYTKEKITLSPQQIIYKNLKEEVNNEYDEYASDYCDRYPYYDAPRYKLEKISKLKNNGFLFKDKGAMQAFSMLIALCSLITWIFKQMHWKEFVFGAIAVALTPLVLGIIGLIMYSIFRFDDETGLALILLAYAIAFFSVIKGLMENGKSTFKLVTTIYLHFYLPLIPIFIYGIMDIHLRRINFDTIFIVGWVIGLLSIGIFKLIYKKYRFLPANK